MEKVTFEEDKAKRKLSLLIEKHKIAQGTPLHVT